MVAERLTRENMTAAITLLNAVNEVRGFGPVKEAALRAYREQLPKMVKAFEQSGERRDG